MRSVMQHQFSQVPKAEIQRSNFNRSHGYKTTFDASYLVPFLVDEVLPGDTFNVRATLFARMNTPIFPIMDNVFLDTFYFFVPNRLLWPNWTRFNGEQDNPGDSTDYLMPVMETAGVGILNPELGEYVVPEGSRLLADYFGLPMGHDLSGVSALPFRAYNLIYNEWFRDENLQDSVPTPWKTRVGVTDAMIDGPDHWEDYQLLRRGKRHDYFTSCLPWPQKGPGVEIPLGSTAPVVSTSTRDGLTGAPLTFADPATGAPYIAPASLGIDGTTGILTSFTFGGGSAAATPRIDNLVADLSGATAATINSLRQAFQLQRLFERDARGGTRYTELIKAHFGVTSPDARLQRPEFLGGGSQRLHVNAVPQTGPTTTESPQGNLAAFATFSDTTGFVRSFTEHGIIIGLLSVRADLTYQQGLDRMWSRSTRFDHYWPALAHLGEQAVLRKEIYSDGTAADDDVFGYQERYAEYRYKPSHLTGKFRSSDPQSLDAWHLAQDFESPPTLSAEFITEDVPIDRVVAVPSEPHFIMDSYINMQCARPMPVYSVPGLIDHF